MLAYTYGKMLLINEIQLSVHFSLKSIAKVLNLRSNNPLGQQCNQHYILNLSQSQRQLQKNIFAMSGLRITFIPQRRWCCQLIVLRMKQTTIQIFTRTFPILSPEKSDRKALNVFSNPVKVCPGYFNFPCNERNNLL